MLSICLLIVIREALCLPNKNFVTFFRRVKNMNVCDIDSVKSKGKRGRRREIENNVFR